MRVHDEEAFRQRKRTSAAVAPRSNPLRELHKYGQSVWLDYIRRHLITSGELQRLVDEDGLRGVTSNPSIFEKALTGSTDYNDVLEAAAQRCDQDPKAIYEALAISDIQQAADILGPVYQQTRRRDGYVSLEVSPKLAHDTLGTVAEARRLWRAIGRDNVMIKVPATVEGIPAIRQLIREGINVNVTLLFSRARYEEVANAYFAGLEQRRSRGDDISRVASVASFFVSRIDTAVENRVNALLKAALDPDVQARLRKLPGKVAIANARLAYQKYSQLYSSPRWRALAKEGAQTQRLLWASTSTKNPSLRDVLYVEELIGADTVNTVPPATLDAFREHGRVRLSLEDRLDEARAVMRNLEQADISLAQITETLLDGGVRLFADSFDRLLAAIEKKRKDVRTCTLNPLTYHLPAHLAAEVTDVLEDWQRSGKVRRLWARDASLWTGKDESKWLDWLGVADEQRAHLERFGALAKDVREAGWTHAVLLGMGVSSLCPDVLARTFGRQAGYPELLVLDSTDPDQIRAVETHIDLKRTLFIVSSKSGTTLEPNLLRDYFLARVQRAVGPADAGRHFIAITDPGSELARAAAADGFRQVFLGVPGIGGRYSALSDFGLVPAAIMGLDVPRFLDATERMVHACAACVPAAENPGVVLGAILGEAARDGRDKVTLITSPGLATLGAWLEQLLAESTGKNDRGLIPVDGERLGGPEVYGDDRLFVYLRHTTGVDAGQDAAVQAVRQAGQPVVLIEVADQYDLGQEFFRWEIATAVAGALLGINPFNQPDVEASKIETRNLTDAYESAGALPPETPLVEEGGLRLYADDRNAAALAAAVGAGHSLQNYLRAHLERLEDSDYFAVLAYVERNEANTEALQSLRHMVRDARGVATCLGFGPRFLHSTGQVYKGGPDSGVFLQITCDDAQDVTVPGHKASFGVVKAAQARGDFAVLAERQRGALRVHLGADVPAGLAELGRVMHQALWATEG